MRSEYIECCACKNMAIKAVRIKYIYSEYQTYLFCSTHSPDPDVELIWDAQILEYDHITLDEYMVFSVIDSWVIAMTTRNKITCCGNKLYCRKAATKAWKRIHGSGIKVYARCDGCRISHGIISLWHLRGWDPEEITLDEYEVILTMTTWSLYIKFSGYYR